MDELEWPPIVQEGKDVEVRYLDDLNEAWIKLVFNAFRLEPEDFQPGFLEKR